MFSYRELCCNGECFEREGSLVWKELPVLMEEEEYVQVGFS